MTFAAAVQRAITVAGVTVIGVAIGNPNDKTTWRVDHLPTATASDITTAANTIATFDPTNTTTISDEKSQDALAIDADLLIQAVATVTWQELQKCQVISSTNPLLTALQFKAAVKMTYKNLLP